MEMVVAAAYCSIDHEVADDIRYNDPMALLNLQAPKFAPHAAHTNICRATGFEIIPR
jgi:hypothetical protein